MKYVDKLSLLKDVQSSVKKKRFVLDENLENFGFEKLSLLHKVKEDEIKGYPFCGSSSKSKILQGEHVGVKVIPLEIGYGKREHPSFLEGRTLKKLSSELVKESKTPHIAFYYGCIKVPLSAKALEGNPLHNLESIKPYCIVLLSEFVKGSSLNNYIRNRFQKKQDDLDLYTWKSIIFSVIFTLNVIQKRYKLMHNDLHYGNILVDECEPEDFVYKNGSETFYLKQTAMVKIWDWEFATAYNKNTGLYPNKFVIDNDAIFDKKTGNMTTEIDTGVPLNYHQVYDLHYFLTSLLDLFIPDQVHSWILGIYPEELVPDDTVGTTGTTGATDGDTTVRVTETHFLKDGRIRETVIQDFDLPTPEDLLKDPFFDIFRKEPSNFSKAPVCFKGDDS